MILVPERPTAYLVGRFVRAYGSGEWYDPTRFQTSDGHVPWKSFVLMSRTLDALEAAEQERIAQAFQIGYTAARSEGASVSRVLDELHERAYPTSFRERVVWVDPASEL